MREVNLRIRTQKSAGYNRHMEATEERIKELMGRMDEEQLDTLEKLAQNIEHVDKVLRLIKEI